LLFPVYPDLGPYPALSDDMLSGDEGVSPAAGKKTTGVFEKETVPFWRSFI